MQFSIAAHFTSKPPTHPHFNAQAANTHSQLTTWQAINLTRTHTHTHVGTGKTAVGQFTYTFGRAETKSLARKIETNRTFIEFFVATNFWWKNTGFDATGAE